MHHFVENSVCGDSGMGLPVTWLKKNQTQSSKCFRSSWTHNRKQEPCLWALLVDLFFWLCYNPSRAMMLSQCLITIGYASSEIKWICMLVFAFPLPHVQSWIKPQVWPLVDHWLGCIYTLHDLMLNCSIHLGFTVLTANHHVFPI
jgi:hypothetical protein